MSTGLILGFFDGVHLAHQAVIRSALEHASDTMLITFKDSPAKFFNKKFEYILNRKDSIQKIKGLGVKDVIELDFEQIANMPAENYLKYLVDRFSPTSIHTGFNHSFGKNKTGNPDFLKENQNKYGYRYFCIPAQKYNDRIISSTLIRELLKNGELEDANHLLGSRFILEGVVIKGAQIGRTINFPTANIEYPKEIIKIPYGVYAAKIGEYRGVLNWGIKPTVNKIPEPIVEIHILDFKRDLYGENIKIELLKKLRDEKKFNSIEELKIQIAKDIEECLKL